MRGRAGPEHMSIHQVLRRAKPRKTSFDLSNSKHTVDPMSTVAEIEAAIERLTSAEIEELAAWLEQRRPSSEFDPAVEEAWSVEIRRRIADFDSGRVPGVPAAEVFSRLRQRLGR